MSAAVFQPERRCLRPRHSPASLLRAPPPDAATSPRLGGPSRAARCPSPRKSGSPPLPASRNGGAAPRGRPRPGPGRRGTAGSASAGSRPSAPASSPWWAPGSPRGSRDTAAAARISSPTRRCCGSTVSRRLLCLEGARGGTINAAVECQWCTVCHLPIEGARPRDFNCSILSAVGSTLLLFCRGEPGSVRFSESSH